MLSLHGVLDVRLQEQPVRLGVNVLHRELEAVKGSRLRHLHVLQESQPEVLEDDPVGRGEKREHVRDEVLLAFRQIAPVAEIRGEIDLLRVPEARHRLLLKRSSLSWSIGSSSSRFHARRRPGEERCEELDPFDSRSLLSRGDRTSSSRVSASTLSSSDTSPFARNVCGNAPTTSISPPSRVGDDVIFSIRRETCSLARVSTRGWSRFGAVCEFGSRGGGCFLRGGQISRGFRARRGHCVRVLRVTER
eukprot:31380-Pelagococcus_subviridis.AAC.5